MEVDNLKVEEEITLDIVTQGETPQIRSKTWRAYLHYDVEG